MTVTMLPVHKLSYLLNVSLILLIIHLANKHRTQGGTDSYGAFQPPKEDLVTVSNLSKPWDVSLVCMVLTTPSNYKLKAVHVAATWGRRCSKLVFLSDHGPGQRSPDQGESWEILQMRGVEGRERLWDKVRYLIFGDQSRM